MPRRKLAAAKHAAQEDEGVQEGSSPGAPSTSVQEDSSPGAPSTGDSKRSYADTTKNKDTPDVIKTTVPEEVDPSTGADNVVVDSAAKGETKTTTDL